MFNHFGNNFPLIIPVMDPKTPITVKKQKKFQKYIPSQQIYDQIISYFALNNYQDFNTWQQVSKSKSEIQFIQQKPKNKNYKCKITLTFQQPSMPVFTNIGEGKNKKQAKKLALQKTISEIIWQGYIALGFKDQNFIQKLPQRRREEDLMKQTKKQQQNNQLTLQIQETLHQIRMKLNADKFKEAVQMLCNNILTKKSPQYHEISKIWQYALKQNNLLYVKEILLKIQNIQNIKNINLPNEKATQKNKIDTLLNKFYTFNRYQNNNPYQTYDSINLKYHVQQKYSNLMHNYTQEKFEEISLFDPFHDDLIEILTPLKIPEQVIGFEFSIPKSQELENPLKKIKKQKPISTTQTPFPFLPPIILPSQKIKLPEFFNLSLIPGEMPKPFLNLPPPIFASLGIPGFQFPAPANFHLQNKSKSNILQNTSFFKNEYKFEIPKFSQNKFESIQQQKQGDISFKLIQALYDSLFFIKNTDFTLQVSEMIYSFIKVKSEDFMDINYYINKKNVLVCQFIQKLKICMQEINNNIRLLTLDGVVNKYVNKHHQQILFFTPKEPDYIIQAKLSKKINTNQFGEMIQIAQGQYALLMSPNQQQTHICLVKQCNPIKLICPTLNIVEPTTYTLYKITNRKLYDKITNAIINISRKQMDLFHEDNTKLIWQCPGASRIFIIQIINQWIRNNCSILVVSNNIDYIYNQLIITGIRSIKITQKTDDKQLSYNKPQVVCVSVTASCCDIIKNHTFTRVLIDQANQISEVMSLLPLVKGCKKLVLVGDPKLPSPIVMSPLAKSKGMCISLFQRLMKQNIPVSYYNEQTKIHYSIANWISEIFYENELKTVKNEQITPTIKGFSWPSSEIRICLIHVQGKQELFRNSIINKNEAQVVLRIVANVLKTGFTSINQIQIISATQSQNYLHQMMVQNFINRQKIELLNQKNDQKLLISQVIQQCCSHIDGFQNIDKDLIIFSACRSNQKGYIGIIGDQKRINSILSKGRRGIIIVGNLFTLAKNKIWYDLITWANAKKLILKLN